MFAQPDINTRGVGRIRDSLICKSETKSRVWKTVENSPNPWSVCIKLCKHRKKRFLLLFKNNFLYKLQRGETWENSYYWSKRIFLQHKLDISQLTNQNLHLKIWWWAMWRVYNSCIFTSHNPVYLLMQARQSERAYYLSYVIKEDNITFVILFQVLALCHLSEWMIKRILVILGRLGI